jgi:hypothetical protein
MVAQFKDVGVREDVMARLRGCDGSAGWMWWLNLGM